MSKMKSWMAGAILGGLIGSVVVLLFTPFTGEEFKSTVRGYVKNIQDEVVQAGEQKRAELEAQLEELRSGNV
ncbi:MAG: YtxH domain-containing protein [Anaerolineaceae bacterium]